MYKIIKDESELLNYGFKYDNDDYAGDAYFKDIHSVTRRGMFVPYVQITTLFTMNNELHRCDNKPFAEYEDHIIQAEIDILIKEGIIERGEENV